MKKTTQKNTTFIDRDLKFIWVRDEEVNLIEIMDVLWLDDISNRWNSWADEGRDVYEYHATLKEAVEYIESL